MENLSIVTWRFFGSVANLISHSAIFGATSFLSFANKYEKQNNVLLGIVIAQQVPTILQGWKMEFCVIYGCENTLQPERLRCYKEDRADTM